MVDGVEPRAAAHAAADGGPALGAPRSEHRRGRAAGALLWLAAALLLADGARAAGRPSGGLARALPSALAAGALLAWASRRRGLRLRLYERGLVVDRLRAGPRRLRYDDVAQVRHAATTISVNGLPIGTHHHLGLLLSDGERLRLTGWRGAKEACAELLRATVPRLTARARAALEAGEEVDFGALRLSSRRLAARGALGRRRELALEEIASYGLLRGTFEVRARGRGGAPFCRVPAGAVANLFVLHALLDQLLAAPRDAAPAVL